MHHFGAKKVVIYFLILYMYFMQEFKSYLQQEFVKRTAKNPAYSLRAFARQLKINHATLSTMISGKRKITESTFIKLSKNLNLSPEELSQFQSLNKESLSPNYFLIQQDAFAAMSEWYFDAILELCFISKFRLEPEIIAQSIDITHLQAKIALDTLERLELLTKDKKGQFKLRHQNSVNILDTNFTSAANRKYQKSVLEKSIKSLESVDRKFRDHTSTTMAIPMKDLPKAKELVQKFRRELNSFLQRPGVKPDQIYQLQVSFFPLTKFKK
jgi:plasmid maintenance system antidote protein VapI